MEKKLSYLQRLIDKELLADYVSNIKRIMNSCRHIADSEALNFNGQSAIESLEVMQRILHPTPKEES